MMNLCGKRLLLMGGGAYVAGIKKYADEQGFYMIAVGSSTKTPLRDIADEFYQIDTQDIEAVTALVKKKKIDGIFVGSSEVNIRSAIKIAERTCIRFYTTQKQSNFLADKGAFKSLLKNPGFPVIREYNEDVDPMAVEYPVLDYPSIGSSRANYRHA